MIFSILLTMNVQPKQYHIKDNGTFPNSELPVLHYKKVLELPAMFPAVAIKRLFKEHNWTNNWRNGIFTFHHYHSNTHEALAVVKGFTTLQLGGDDGLKVMIEKGDVIIIPAGVAHRNLGHEKQVICVGGYPDGRSYDMNYGKTGERPGTDENIAAIPKPATDPVMGHDGGLPEIW
jgi:uncharacterized protein YjlB